MKRMWIGCALGLCLVGAVQADEGQMQMSEEQAAMMQAWIKAATPGEQHRELAERTGTWKMNVSMWTEPGQDPQVSMGTAERTMILGGRVLQETVQGTMAGIPFEGLGFTGFDNVTGEYWTTWMDSSGTGIAYSPGAWDEALGGIVFEGTMSDPMVGPKTFKTVSVVNEDGTETFTMFEMRDGEEVQGLQIVYSK